MICPYCDSLIRDLSDNRVCPYCGAALGMYCKPEVSNQKNDQQELSPRKIEVSFPDPPIGTYKDAAGYLEIGKNSVTFYRKQFFKGSKRTIQFQDIYAVSYKPGVTLNSGFLCVREWKDRNIPLAQKSADVPFDETSVYFRKSKNAMFEQVYNFLKQCEMLIRSTEIEG